MLKSSTIYTVSIRIKDKWYGLSHSDLTRKEVIDEAERLRPARAVREKVRFMKGRKFKCLGETTQFPYIEVQRTTMKEFK